MARSSQAKGNKAPPALTPKGPPVRAKAGRAVGVVAQPESAAASGPVVRAHPQPEPVASAPADAPAPADRTPPEPVVTDEPGAASHAIDAPAGAAARPSELFSPPAPAVIAAATLEADATMSEPAAPAAVAEPVPPRAAGAGADLTAMFQASRTLIEGLIRVRAEMIAFGWRRAEHGFALGRALLTPGSLPQLLAVQAEYLQEAVEDALAQNLELGRLSSDVVRAGLESGRRR